MKMKQVTPLQKKILLLLAVSLAIHLVLTACYAHTFDYEYWLMVMQNIETGNDLYGLDAFYYTPVWGDLLSFCDLVIEACGIIPQWGDRFIELVPTEDLRVLTQATLASPAMNFAIKACLAVADLAVGYVIFILIRDLSGSEKKGLIAMALWCFNPIIIYMSAGQGQFDNISTLLLLVTVLLLRRKSYFMAGIIYGMAVWIKIFPGFCLFILIAYMWTQHRDDRREALKSMGLAAAGLLLTTAVLFLPVILNGELAQAFSFLSSRTMVMTEADRLRFYRKIAWALLTVLLIFVYMLRRSYACPEKADHYLLYGIGGTVMAASLILPGYQYAASLMIFPIVLAVLPSERGYRLLGYAIFTVLTATTFTIAIFFMGPAGLSIVSAFFGTNDLTVLCQQIIDFLTGSFRTGVHIKCSKILEDLSLFCTVLIWTYIFRNYFGRLFDWFVKKLGGLHEAH